MSLTQSFVQRPQPAAFGMPTAASSQPPVSPATLSRLINLAGRQRMLSQRLTLFLVLASQGQGGALDSAESVLRELNASHKLLLQGGEGLPGLFSANLRQLFDGPAQSRQRIQSFLTMAEDKLRALRQGAQQATHLQADIVDAASTALDLFNKVTQAYEAEAQSLAREQQLERARLIEAIQSVAREARVVAFNAQVSAYRAGPSGGEFAVVAQRMATVTEEIDSLARASQAVA